MADTREAAALEEFRRLVRAELDGREPESLEHETPEGIRQRALYVRADLDALEHTDSVPGAYPFVRGVRPSMYLGRPWTIRQYAGFSSAEESNAFYKQNLAGGQKG
ncbi:MAG TPA: methylmalonyl-CoA mutase family protein, partial [Polyangiaceae bacterium]